MEHLALHSDLTLKDFCSRLMPLLDLPEFEYDFENETEWGESKAGDLTFNVSRPYEAGTLTRWNDTVPESCNFGITIARKEVDQAEIWRIGQVIADAFNETVHYHTSWIRPGKTIKREIEIRPGSKGDT